MAVMPAPENTNCLCWTSQAHIWRPHMALLYRSSSADDLLRVELQRKRAKRNVNLPPDNAVNNLRDLGFDFASVVEADEDG
jgi:hypothetical protein